MSHLSDMKLVAELANVRLAAVRPWSKLIFDASLTVAAGGSGTLNVPQGYCAVITKLLFDAFPVDTSQTPNLAILSERQPGLYAELFTIGITQDGADILPAVNYHLLRSNVLLVLQGSNTLAATLNAPTDITVLPAGTELCTTVALYGFLVPEEGADALKNFVTRF